ncbi:plasmid mobilization relaxosome protein MobC [Ochrobactrum sp. C6C9]|nr:plasmid mobilization relaxosome protein MobC [Ochrobactrum sp. C6C9]
MLLNAKAERAGVSVSHLLREALNLVGAKRRRAFPRVDPALLGQLARIGGNLNQIARWLNAAAATGQARQIDALVVATRLVAIERALSLLATPHALAFAEANNGESGADYGSSAPLSPNRDASALEAGRHP